MDPAALALNDLPVDRTTAGRPPSQDFWDDLAVTEAIERKHGLHDDLTCDWMGSD